MDGLPHLLDLQGALEAKGPGRAQQTLRTAIHCTGVGVHSGRRSNLVLHPAAPGTGIVFRRSDLGIDIPARFDHVVDTRLCTVLGLPGRRDATIGTVEHVMAALSGMGISNCIVEVDGPEVPILDGSAAPFVFLIECAGIEAQAAPERAIAIRRPIRVTQDDAFVELRPYATTPALSISMSIAFTDAAIGEQSLALRLTGDSFRRELAAARTFGRAADVAALQAHGLALGGSLDNAVVVDGAAVLNPGGLRMADEFVRHKMLDAVGDIALSGAPLLGRLVAHKSGHALNNRLLHALFADDANWAWVSGGTPATLSDGAAGLPSLGSWQERRLPVAAAPV
jgi:UDP-3-O-[3-hydroxymyristoyl] N-acetylglucosamine deacetylase